MSTARDPARRAVALALRVRHHRARVLLAIVAAEAAFLLLIGATPVLHLVLPVVALPLLVPYLVFGRARLPAAEWQGWDHDDDDAASSTGEYRGTHQFLGEPWSDGDIEGRDVVLLATRATHGLRAERAFLAVEAAGILLVVTPRSYWLQRGGDVRHGEASGIGVGLFDITETVRMPRADDEVLGSTWLHATKRGERDLRYRDNHRLYEVRRHGIELAFGGERWTILLYARSNAVGFGNALLAIVAPGSVLSADEEDDSLDEDEGELEDEPDDEDDDGGDGDGAGDDEEAPRPWHDVLAVSPGASAAEIKAAYRERLKEYHPDRVAHLGEKLRAVATAEATAINAAYAEAMRRVRMQG